LLKSHLVDYASKPPRWCSERTRIWSPIWVQQIESVSLAGWPLRLQVVDVAKALELSRWLPSDVRASR